jgi:hypothetical protein
MFWGFGDVIEGKASACPWLESLPCSSILVSASYQPFLARDRNCVLCVRGSSFHSNGTAAHFTQWLGHSSCFPSLLYYSKAASATVPALSSFTTTLISIGGSNSTSSLRRNPSQHAACCSFQCLSPFRKETLLSFCFLFHFTLS